MATGEIHIELAVNYGEDPKMRALARFGRDARGCRDLYVQMTCYCKRNLTDGYVPAEEIGVLVYPDTPKNGERDAGRLVEVGLLERVDGGYRVCAYIKRNKSKAEVLDLAEKKASGGSLGNHVRWHEGEGIYKEGCRFCRDGSSGGDPDSVTERSQAKKDQSRNGVVTSPRHNLRGEGEPGGGGESAHADGATTLRSVASPQITPDMHHHSTDRTSDRTSDRSSDEGANRERSPETETETETETEEKTPPNPQRGKSGSRRPKETPEFATFWEIYPRKVGKAKALEAWHKAIAAGAAPEVIINGAQAYVRDPVRRSSDIKFTAHPATWLNQERWADEAPTLDNVVVRGGWWNN